MEYHLMPTDALLGQFKLNVSTIAGSVQTLIGEEPLPDPRVINDLIKDVSIEEFWEAFKENAPETEKNMDIQRLIADITWENVMITSELLKRTKSSEGL